MCGISGVISQKTINKISLLEMNQVIKHRGPDDEGFVMFNNSDIQISGSSDTAKETWNAIPEYIPDEKIENTDFEANVAFGHRRLSILDLSPKGHQPMCYSNQRYWITFNGEVYNYKEIRDELIELGFNFQTDTDTEAVLAAYEKWGIDCQNKFNGMWAFAIYDIKEQTIFISRDRFGIKPFYYWFNPDGDFFFASEIKQFTVLPGWKAVLNGARAYDYLHYALMDHTDETLFTNVYSVLPGHSFFGKVSEINTSNGNKLNIKKWYNPKITKFNGTFDEAKETFLEKFKDSIRFHLRADVPVGSALSGGLDSSSIVSYVNILLKEQGKSELQKTFSSCSEDERYDERKWMDEVVNETKVDGHFVYPKGEDVFKNSEKIVWHLDEPYQSQSAFLSYHVFKEAKDNDVIVLLNGQGADEYLSGYGAFTNLRHKNLIKNFKVNTLFKETKNFSSILKTTFSIMLDTLPNRLRYQTSLLLSDNKVFNLDMVHKKKTHPYVINNYENGNHVKISNYQLYKDPLQKYLKWEDRNSMAHSVEARVPFLDYRLVEFTHSLPLNYLDSAGELKKILVEAMEGILPEKVKNRKDKKGFMTPEERWLKEDFKSAFLEMLKVYGPYAKGIINEKAAKKYILSVQEGQSPFNYTYWRIIVFCVWMKVFDVQLN